MLDKVYHKLVQEPKAFHKIVKQLIVRLIFPFSTKDYLFCAQPIAQVILAPEHIFYVGPVFGKHSLFDIFRVDLFVVVRPRQNCGQKIKRPIVVF
jgi:hypothetical protein